MSTPDSTTHEVKAGQLGGIRPALERRQPERSAGPRSGGIAGSLSCPAWFVLGSDDEIRRGWVLYCDLDPGHPGDLHYDEIDDLHWKAGDA